MKNKTKMISRKLAVIVLVIAILVSLSIPFAVYFDQLSNKNQAVLNGNLASARAAVENYKVSYAARKFAFNDNAFKKAEIVKAYLNENSKQEEIETLAKNLKLDSIAITDIDGKYVAAYPKDLVGKNIRDNKDSIYLARITQGTTKKCVTEPKSVSENNDEYKYYCGISREKDGNLVGAVVIGEKTTEYDEVLGSDIIFGCEDNTIIAKDGNIVSSSLDGTSGMALDNININKDDMNKESTFTWNKTEYVCKAEKAGEFTIICSIPLQTSGVSTNKFAVFAGAFLAGLAVGVLALFLNFKPRKDDEV